MNKLVNYYNAHKKVIVRVVSIVFVILLILPFAFHKNVRRNNVYTDRDDVARYIMKYHELPVNYITKSSLDYANNHHIQLPEYTVVGGDDFFQTEKITNCGYRLPKNVHLKECDIMCDGYDIETNKRMIYRFLYTTNSNIPKVFYTDSHYGSTSGNNPDRKAFVKLTRFRLQLGSNICWIIFATYTLSVGSLYFVVNKKSTPEPKKELLN